MCVCVCVCVAVLFPVADLTENTKICYVYTMIFSVTAVSTAGKGMYSY